MQQAAAANGKAMAENGCGPDTGGELPPGIQAADGRFLQELGRTLERGEDVTFGPTLASSVRAIACRIEEGAKRQAAEREAKKARDEVAAECRLVEEELGRAAGVSLKATTLGSTDRLELAAPDQGITIHRDGLWWRLYLAAARELRRLRAALAAKPRPEKPPVVIGRHTLDQLREGLCVPLDCAVLYPASDFPSAAVKFALQLDGKGLLP